MLSKKTIETKSNSGDQSGLISFPINSKGLFSFFSELSFFDLIDQIDTKFSVGYEIDLLRLFCSDDYLYFDPKTSFQFQFIKSQFKLFGYKIQTDFSKWNFFGSNDNLNWIIINHIDRQNYDYQMFQFEESFQFSFFKIEFEDEEVNNIYHFELFGTMKMNDDSIDFINVIPRTNPILIPQSIFSFSENRGLFAFVKSLSTTEALISFSLVGSQTTSDSSVFNLLKDYESTWHSTDAIDSNIMIGFHANRSFNLTSFKLKSGSSLFLQSWQVVGWISHTESKIIAQFENEQSLSNPFAESIFTVPSSDYFRRIYFKQTGTNSNGNHIFSLSQIEIYGELKYQLF